MEALLLLRDWNYRTPHVPLYLDSLSTVGLMNFHGEGKRRETRRSNFHCTDVQRNATQEPKWRDELPLRARSACKMDKYSAGDKVPAQDTQLVWQGSLPYNNKFWEEFTECLPLSQIPRPDLIVTVRITIYPIPCKISCSKHSGHVQFTFSTNIFKSFAESLQLSVYRRFAHWSFSYVHDFSVHSISHADFRRFINYCSQIDR